MFPKPVGAIAIFHVAYWKWVEVSLKIWKAKIRKENWKVITCAVKARDIAGVSPGFGNSLSWGSSSQGLSPTAVIFPCIFITYQPLGRPTVLKRREPIALWPSWASEQSKSPEVHLFSDWMSHGQHTNHLQSFLSFSLSQIKYQCPRLSFLAYFYPYNMDHQLNNQTMPLPQIAFQIVTYIWSRSSSGGGRAVVCVFILS